MELTKKQDIYATEYVKCDNKTQAYRVAYDTSNMLDKSVHEKASELSRNVKVKARIKELKDIAKEVANKNFKIDSKQLLGHLNILRLSRIDEYVNYVEYEEKYESKIEDGKIETRVVRELQFKPFAELSKEQLMCIESIKEGRNGIELKLHGKDWAIDRIAKHIGFYEKDNTQKKIADRVIVDMSDYNKDKK